MTIFDDLAKQNGFESQQELFRLVATVSINTSEKLAAFKQWQENDGTKDGLLKLIEDNNEQKS